MYGITECSNFILFLKTIFGYARCFVAARGLSLVSVSRGYSLVVLSGPLIAVASVVWSTGSRLGAQ